MAGDQKSSLELSFQERSPHLPQEDLVLLDCQPDQRLTIPPTHTRIQRHSHLILSYDQTPTIRHSSNSDSLDKQFTLCETTEVNDQNQFYQFISAISNIRGDEKKSERQSEAAASLYSYQSKDERPDESVLEEDALFFNGIWRKATNEADGALLLCRNCAEYVAVVIQYKIPEASFWGTFLCCGFTSGDTLYTEFHRCRQCSKLLMKVVHKS